MSSDTSDAPDVRTQRSRLRQRLGQVFLAAVFAVVLISVLLPSRAIGWMRHNWTWFTLPLDRIESMESPVNLVHLVLFLLLGMAMALALRHWSFARVAVVIVLLGVTTELVQLLVPGRHARLTDVLVDIAAGLLGWAIVRRVSG